MRIAFSIIFLLLIIGLGICHNKAMRSRKRIGPAVAAMVGALIPPVIGNLIIISSTDRTLSTIGCYIYFLGMDVVMYTLLRFAMEYCSISKKGRNTISLRMCSWRSTRCNCCATRFSATPSTRRPWWWPGEIITA